MKIFLKARIHCETFLSEHFMKFSLRSVSWSRNSFTKYFYFSMWISACKFLINKRKIVYREKISFDSESVIALILINKVHWKLLPRRLPPTLTPTQLLTLAQGGFVGGQSFGGNFTEGNFLVKDKQYFLLYSKNKKKSKISKRIWMKPWMKKRNDKSAWVNIFSELLLDDKFWQYLQVNATSYIDFYTLITYTSYITYTYNHTTCIDYFITILVFTIHYSF